MDFTRNFARNIILFLFEHKGYKCHADCTLAEYQYILFYRNLSPKFGVFLFTSQCELKRDKNKKLACVSSEDTDQHRLSFSLISLL